MVTFIMLVQEECHYDDILVNVIGELFADVGVVLACQIWLKEKIEEE